eukprot:2625227-Prymnesium_polylepis.2
MKPPWLPSPIREQPSSPTIQISDALMLESKTKGAARVWSPCARLRVTGIPGELKMTLVIDEARLSDEEMVREL